MSQNSYQIPNFLCILYVFVYIFMIGPDMVVKLISELSNAFMT